MKNGFRITVVYDNHTPKNNMLKPSWGFACVIEGFEKTILFDTGTSGSILLNNLTALGFDPAQIDLVIISHGDWDHVGGIWSFLDAHPDVDVYLPASLSKHLMDEIRVYGSRVFPVDAKFLSVFPGAVLSGEMEGPRNEQALLLQTNDKYIVITGCAHPGVVPMTRRLAETASGDLPMLVMGGFHLKNSPAPEIERTVQELKNLDARWVAPTHCTGELAESIFADRFGKHCLSLCPGSVITEKGLEE